MTFVCEQGETYSLFQDKVDEAEARLEVAADTSHTCRKRCSNTIPFSHPDYSRCVVYCCGGEVQSRKQGEILFYASILAIVDLHGAVCFVGAVRS